MPPPAPADVAAAVAARDVLPEDIAAAVDWAGLPPLRLDDPGRGSTDPDDVAFWRGSAWAFHPAVRRARGELQVARARAGAAGRPMATGVELETVDPSGDDRETELNVLFDLLGLLGAGYPEATRALADAEALAALGHLERAAWAALAEVERALAGVGVAQARLAALEELLAEAEADVPRIDVLMHSGWAAPADAGAAVAAILELQHHVSNVRVELAAARARLARAAGLPPDDPAVLGVTMAALERLHPPEGEPPRPAAAELVQRLPELRVLALQCGVAEAHLRRAAAARWPRLAVGPRLIVGEDDTLVGGVLHLDLPWPGTLDAEMEAAQAMCVAAREELEDGLLAALVRAEERAVRLHEAWTSARLHLPDIDEAYATRWHAARTRFQSEPQALSEWTAALRERIAPLLEAIDGRGTLAVAAVDLREAAGLPQPAAPLAGGPGEGTR